SSHEYGVETGSVGDTGRVTQAILDSPALNEAVERAADPAAARAFLTRLLDDHVALGDELSANPLVRDALVGVRAAGRARSGAVCAAPLLLAPLRAGEGFTHERALSEYRDSAALFFATTDDGPGALRR